MGEVIHFIPRNRRYLEDFPVIPFKVPTAPIAPANAHERELYDMCPCECIPPGKEPA
jgi:hypothetical protein